MSQKYGVIFYDEVDVFETISLLGTFHYAQARAQVFKGFYVFCSTFFYPVPFSDSVSVALNN